MYIDTHAHLNFEGFKNSYKTVISRANSSNVKKIICPSSNLETSKKAIKIAKECPSVYAAVGVHAIHVNEEEFSSEFAKLAKDKNVVAIGETGIDYYYDKSSAERQKEIFEKHLKLANLVGKPVIMHARDSYEDMIAMLTSQTNLPKGVLHCFLGNLEIANIFMELGFLLSFTGIITFTKNHELLKVIREIPLEKIMIETDAPYLAPEPFRGKQNEPAYVVEVAKKIAEIKNVSIDKVGDTTSQNAIELFKLT